MWRRIRVRNVISTNGCIVGEQLSKASLQPTPLSMHRIEVLAQRSGHSSYTSVKKCLQVCILVDNYNRSALLRHSTAQCDPLFVVLLKKTKV